MIDSAPIMAYGALVNNERKVMKQILYCVEHSKKTRCYHPLINGELHKLGYENPRLAMRKAADMAWDIAHARNANIQNGERWRAVCEVVT